MRISLPLAPGFPLAPHRGERIGVRGEPAASSEKAPLTLPSPPRWGRRVQSGKSR
jgi:hypothetical protein